MRIGVPKEIKNHEYRVGLTPQSVAELSGLGHQLWVETQAGAAIGFSDQDYLNAGAQIAQDLRDSGRSVNWSLAQRHSHTRRLRGKDSMTWWDMAGRIHQHVSEAAGVLAGEPDALRKARSAEFPLISGKGNGGLGSSISLLAMHRAGIRLLGRLQGFDGNVARFADVRPQLRTAIEATQAEYAYLDSLASAYYATRPEPRTDDARYIPEEVYLHWEPDAAPRELDLQAEGIRSVVLASQTQDNPNNNLPQFVQQLGMLMTTWQATTFLIGEYFTETETNPIFTVADGLIWLRQSVQRNSMVRKMEIMKMRGQPTLPGLHTFRIATSGIKVFAPAALNPVEAPLELPIKRLKMGVPQLDEMLGGGLPRGYSLLVAGPSGSGKSILAATFLAEGARNGETGVIAVFEQRPNHFQNATLIQLIQNGQVGLVDSRAPDLSIDEVVQLLMAEISRLKATRLVIDSLSGFELALAPTFREDFRESLSRMVTALTGAGVSVLMTSELEDRYTDLRFSPFGNAFLADAIIMQRYIELAGQFKRVISVVKVRGSAHSKDIRLFDITDDGIVIGGILSDYNGITTGSPEIDLHPKCPPHKG